jgi:NitT/TauT family transport system substrate-binding protein
MQRRTLLTTLAAGLAAPAITRAQAEQTTIKFSLDWAFQGPQAVFTLAESRGYFRDEGLSVTMDRGQGSGDTAVRVASGAYDIGFADTPPMILLSARNPERLLTAVYMAYDVSALAVMTLADRGIRTPRDLEGKRLGAPEVDAGRQFFPAFARATGINAASITWSSMQAQLREPMLIRREVDAVTGFVTAGIPTFLALGIPAENIVTMRYREHGVDLYGSALFTTPQFAERNPNTLRRFVRAINRAFRESVANPRAAVETLPTREPTTQIEPELRRLLLSHRELVLTPHAREHGVSSVVPARWANAVRLVGETYNIAPPPPERLWTDRFLPPREERALPALGA